MSFFIVFIFCYSISISKVRVPTPKCEFRRQFKFSISIESSMAKVQPLFELGEKVFPLFSTCFPLFFRSFEICENVSVANIAARVEKQCTTPFSTCSLTRSYKLLNSEKENSASSFFLTFLLIGV